MQSQTIIHGNSFELLQDIPTNSVQAIITDPPYDFTHSDMDILNMEFMRISKGSIIIFCPPENQWYSDDIPTPEYGFWVKPVSTKNTSKRYSRFVEMIMFYHKEGAVWDSSRHWSQYTNTFHDRVEAKMTHPFTKPLSLMRRLIENHTNEGDIILDPFAGSGATLRAAKSVNRGFIGIEKDAEYFNNLHLV